jgi:hypothetical protein
MVYPLSRSMNADLHEGATDGKYKKVIQGRGGVVESTTYRDRSDLFDGYFGIHETDAKVSGDGVVAPTPNFVPTREPQEVWAL